MPAIEESGRGGIGGGSRKRASDDGGAGPAGPSFEPLGEGSYQPAVKVKEEEQQVMGFVRDNLYEQRVGEALARPQRRPEAALWFRVPQGSPEFRAGARAERGSRPFSVVDKQTRARTVSRVIKGCEEDITRSAWTMFLSLGGSMPGTMKEVMESVGINFEREVKACVEEEDLSEEAEGRLGARMGRAVSATCLGIVSSARGAEPIKPMLELMTHERDQRWSMVMSAEAGRQEQRGRLHLLAKEVQQNQQQQQAMTSMAGAIQSSMRSFVAPLGPRGGPSAGVPGMPPAGGGAGCVHG